MYFLLGLLLSIGADGRRPGPSCTLEHINRYTGPRESGYLVVRATADTVSDGRYYLTMGRAGLLRTPEYSGQVAHEVFGQVFDLISAHEVGAEELAAHRQVVFIWWQLSLSCSRFLPRSTRRVESGDVFLLKQPRPRAEWVAGMPTYDVDIGDWVYSPELDRRNAIPNGAAREMTLLEFLDYFRLLPRRDEKPPRAQSEVLQRILAWGAENPERWTLWPANTALCYARTVVTGDRSCPPR